MKYEFPSLFNDSIVVGSYHSKDGKHRYWLTRQWNEKPFALCIGLNPSTANALKDDPTIRLLKRLLKPLGFGGFYMVNLFSLISSKPEVLRDYRMEDIIFDNQKIKDVAGWTTVTIFCWGAFEEAKPRVEAMRKMFPDAMCFGKNQDGSPWHPRAMAYMKGFVPQQLMKF